MRLAASKLMEAHHAFYQRMGPLAWNVVPDYISTNAFVASCYVKLILSYVKDLIRANLLVPHNQTSEEEETIDFWVIELGAGTGNLSYLILRALSLSPIVDALYVEHNGRKYPIRIRLVMTDFAERNVEYWEHHGYFNQFIKNGQVDFAVYNVLEDRRVHLKYSNKVLSLDTLHGNPVVLIGNYLLDTLPHDAFSIANDTISEVGLHYRLPMHHTEPGFSAAALKKNQWKKRVIFPPNLYEDDEELNVTAAQLQAEQLRREREEGEQPGSRPLPPEFHTLTYYRRLDGIPSAQVLDEILEKYRTSFYGGQASLLLPVGGFQMLDCLFETFGRSLMFLAGDKGDVCLGDLEGRFPPSISLHGDSLSFMCNFHAMEEYWNRVMAPCDSQVLLGSSCHDFKVCTFIGGANQAQLRELNGAYEEVNQFGPDDYYRTYRSVNPHAKPSVIHAMLRMSRNDPGMFYQYKNQLVLKLPKSWWKNVMIPELIRMWANYYPRIAAAEEDIPYSLGEIFLACERHEEAIPFFRKSLELSGNYYSTNFHIGLCYEKLGNLEEALSHYERCSSAELDVEDDDVSERIAHLRATLDHEKELKRKEKQQEEKRRAEMQTRKEREQIKSQRAQRERSDLHAEPSLNPMGRRTGKYGHAVAQASASEEEEEEEPEEEEEEEDEEIDDDYAPLLL